MPLGRQRHPRLSSVLPPSSPGQEEQDGSRGVRAGSALASTPLSGDWLGWERASYEAMCFPARPSLGGSTKT